MSQLKVNTIRHTGASSDAITLAADGTAAIGECTAKVTNNLSNRNLIINGAFQIAQRGTSSTTAGFGSVDRFQCSFGGGQENCTHSQHDLTSSDTGPWAAGFRKSFHLQNGNQTSGAQGNDFAYISYGIEAQDIANSGWNYNSASSYITLSFWVKSSVAGQQYVYFYCSDGTAQGYSFDAGVLSANTWTKVTHSIPGHANLTFNNDTGIGMSIYWGPHWGDDMTDSGHTLNTWAAYSGTSRTRDFPTTWWTTNDATFELTGVQLELGDTATDFEHRSYTDELLRCYRYYYKIADGSVDTDSPLHSGTFYGAHNMYGPVNFPMEMRTTPTLDVVTGTNYYQCYYNATTANHDAISLNNVTPTVATLVATTNLTGANAVSSWCRTQNASAYVALTAE